MRWSSFFLLIIALYAQNAFAQKKDARCTIIDMSKDEGTFTIRDRSSGRIQVFKPDALEGAELKVGDTVDVLFDLKKVTSVKGSEKSYDLLDPAFADSCCTVIKIDSVDKDSLFTVTARNNTTGENFNFRIPAVLASQMKDGALVFTKPSHGYAMIIAAEADTTRRALYGFPLLQN